MSMYDALSRSGKVSALRPMLGVERQLAKNQLGKVKKIQKEGLGNQVRQLHREDGCQVIRLGSAIAKTGYVCSSFSLHFNFTQVVDVKHPVGVHVFVGKQEHGS